MSLSNDVYGNTLALIASDDVSDYYLVGDAIPYTFPKGTSIGIVYVTIAIQTNLIRFKAASQDYIQTLYPQSNQIQLLAIYLAAQAGGLTNRAAYIGQLLTWLNEILAYSSTYISAVQALTNPVTIAATVWDASQFPVDPGVTLLGAMAIMD